MIFLTAFSIILYAAIILAMAARLIRRYAPSAARPRTAAVAVMRGNPDTNSPIVGWIVRDVPHASKLRVRDSAPPGRLN